MGGASSRIALVGAPVISLGDAQDVTAVVEQIAAALRSGGVVLLPTDTVYGLAALPTQAAIIEGLFALKGRTTATPLAVLCTDVDQAIGLADPSVGAAVAAVGARWWPGPLTLVVPRRPGVDLHLGEPSTTIGLRVPDHDLIRAIAAEVGPIAATSANRHGEPTPTTAVAAAAALGSGIAVIVDGGEVSVGASTVVDATRVPWTVLRDGPIPGAEVARVSDASADPDR